MTAAVALLLCSPAVCRPLHSEQPNEMRVQRSREEGGCDLRGRSRCDSLEVEPPPRHLEAPLSRLTLMTAS